MALASSRGSSSDTHLSTTIPIASGPQQQEQQENNSSRTTMEDRRMSKQQLPNYVNLDNNNNSRKSIAKAEKKLKQFVKQITLPCSPSSKDQVIVVPVETSREKGAVAEQKANTNNASSKDLEAGSPPPQPSNKKPKKSKILKYRGFFFAVISSLCFSLTALIVKSLKDYNSVNLALWRFQGAFIPAIPLMIYHQISVNRRKGEKSQEAKKVEKDKWGNLKIVGLLVLRSIFTCNALLLHFYSLKYLPVGDALVILSSTPVFAYIIAYFILREPLGIVPVATSFTTLLGVVFILRPPTLTGQGSFDYDTLVGTGLALASTILATISYCLLRYSRGVHFSLTTFFFGAWGTVENLIVAFALGVFSLPTSTRDWWLGGALAILTFFGQIAIILALKYEKAGPVTLIRTVDVLFGFLWQILFFHVVPDMFTLIGAGIVVSGVFIIGFRKWIGVLPPDDKLRLKFTFMLK